MNLTSKSRIANWAAFSLIGLLAALLVSVLVAGCAGKKVSTKIILATTTSTQDTGLLDELIPKFEEEKGIKVSVIAVGSGEAIAMGMRGDADVLLVHSPEDEKEFVKQGYGVNRKAVMQNDFVIIGPGKDPAKIKGLKDAAKAFKRIAQHKATFITRGDNSGTHKKELSIWKQAGIEPTGDWYVNAGQGMGATARIANEKDAYTIIDRGTYLSLKKSLKLVMLVENAKGLINSYSVIGVNPKKFSRVRYKEAVEFINWITSTEMQEMIGEFGKDKYGQALFKPTAK